MSLIQSSNPLYQLEPELGSDRLPFMIFSGDIAHAEEFINYYDRYATERKWSPEKALYMLGLFLFPPEKEYYDQIKDNLQSAKHFFHALKDKNLQKSNTSSSNSSPNSQSQAKIRSTPLQTSTTSHMPYNPPPYSVTIQLVGPFVNNYSILILIDNTTGFINPIPIMNITPQAIALKLIKHFNKRSFPAVIFSSMNRFLTRSILYFINKRANRKINLSIISEPQAVVTLNSIDKLFFRSIEALQSDEINFFKAVTILYSLYNSHCPIRSKLKHLSSSPHSTCMKAMHDLALIHFQLLQNHILDLRMQHNTTHKQSYRENLLQKSSHLSSNSNSIPKQIQASFSAPISFIHPEASNQSPTSMQISPKFSPVNNSTPKEQDSGYQSFTSSPLQATPCVKSISNSQKTSPKINQEPTAIELLTSTPSFQENFNTTVNLNPKAEKKKVKKAKSKRTEPTTLFKEFKFTSIA